MEAPKRGDIVFDQYGFDIYSQLVLADVEYQCVKYYGAYFSHCANYILPGIGVESKEVLVYRKMLIK